MEKPERLPGKNEKHTMRTISRLLLNDRFIIGLIFINSLVIFLQGFDVGKTWQTALIRTDHIITLVFLLELIVKLRNYGLKGFLQSNWNIFDAILIILAIPSLFIWLFDIDGMRMEFLLILRVSRIFKFFRFLHFIPDIDQLIKGVQRALKASVIVMLGFMVYNFVISIVSCFMFRDIAPEYFANPLVSLYSIFKIFTMEGWYEIPEQIAANSNEVAGALTKIFFVIIVFTGGVLGLSLVNSIFVDAMVSDNNDDLERKIDRLERKIDRLIEKQ